jgi:hypothetical protein
MSLLRLRDTNEVPPDGYRFVMPENGYRIGPINRKDDWLLAIKKHRDDNGYPSPDNWRELAEDQLARTLPSGWAFYEDGSEPENYVDRRMGFEDIIRGTKVLLEFVRQGAPLVEQKEAERRARICAACYLNLPVHGCAPCVGLANLVEDVAQQRKTEADAQLENSSCGVCRCMSRAQIWLPIDILAKGVSAEMMKLWPYEFCWKGQQLREFLDNPA